MQHETTSTNDAPTLDRRAAMGVLGGAALLGAAAPAFARRQEGGAAPGLSAADLGWDAAKGEYVLPPLPYAFDALEPHIDAQTMEIHHDRHHAGYVRGLNTALAKLAELRAGDADAGMVKHWTQALAFHGSGHVNHTLFWMTMAPADGGGGGTPGGALGAHIDADFGSFDGFAKQFKAAAGSVEGSGWAWLCLEPVGNNLLILQAEKQQNMASMGVMPLLGVDVWEHAYYLKYQNRRGDYINAFMDIINWTRVGTLYERARGLKS
jgi:Fe-Mn family superoxide dismutase